MAAVKAPVDFPPGRAQEPDPLCGRRVSIRPQPTRAPGGEVMALNPSGGGGVMFGWWHGVPLQGGAVAGWQGTHPPHRYGCPSRWERPGTCQPPPPPGRAVTVVWADGKYRLTGEWPGGGVGHMGTTPPPLPPPLAALQTATNFFCSLHEDHGRGRGRGHHAPPPPTPLAPAAAPRPCPAWWCSPLPASGEGGPAPLVSSPPSKGCALGSCASGTSSPGCGMGGTPTTSARTAPSGRPRGPPSPGRCNGGTPTSSLRPPPPAPTTRAPVSSTRGAGTWRHCWHLHPCRRLTLFEGETAAGRPHAVAVEWWHRVWDNDPARSPLRTPIP